MPQAHQWYHPFELNPPNKQHKTREVQGKIHNIHPTNQELLQQQARNLSHNNAKCLFTYFFVI